MRDGAARLSDVLIVIALGPRDVLDCLRSLLRWYEDRLLCTTSRSPSFTAQSKQGQYRSNARALRW
jgi:hypothetical protein